MAKSSAPTVSVIMPTFNRRQWLQAAVESVRAQSLADWELLIADDGSDADTHAYLRGLDAPPRIRVQFLPHTGNPGAVRNVALRQARGEFIAFLDADDVWLPEKLHAQVGALRTRERVWGYTGFTLVNADGEVLEPATLPARPAIEGPFLEPLLRGEPLIVQSSVLVRRELLQVAGGYDEEFRICSDYDLWIRLARHYEVAFLPDALVRVRRHGSPYFDEVAALGELRRMFDKVSRSGCTPAIQGVLRERQAGASAGLALAYAQRGQRFTALRALAASALRSWPYRRWWRGALRTTARSFVPMRLMRLVSKDRSRL